MSRFTYFSVFTIIAVSLFSINTLFAQNADYKTVRLDIVFTCDIGALEIHAGFYKSLQYPRGFRKGGMKITYNGSLSQFEVSTTRIQVVKYEQYDNTPFTISILYDMPSDWERLTIYTNHGDNGNVTGKIFDLEGKQLGEFTSSFIRGWENWNLHDVQFE